MLFTEFRFFPFLALAFLVTWALRANSARKVWLLICSYVFYAAWDWRFLSLIVVSTLVDYVAGLRIESARGVRGRRGWLLGSLAANLGMLGFFKYWNFFIDSANDLLQLAGFASSLPLLSIVLPVGISFFTFQTMSYSIEVYRRNLRPTRSLLDLALFVGFFPQLVAGPIVRARTFLPQLKQRPAWVSVDVRPYLVLFLVGFFKKACVADGLAPFVDTYFDAPWAYDAASGWVAVTFYAAQIYCDFSGYSDMAIASAGLLGYRLTDNFAFPYLAGSITDFWRRWHMSLSSWLRDYLYIPLGGNRNGAAATRRNLMLTMLLGGLWHGAAWNFIIWGGLHGLALMVHGAWRRLVGDRLAWFMRLLGPVLTFYWVCIAWIFFRTGSLDLAARQARTSLLDQVASGEMSASAQAGQLALLNSGDGIARSWTILKSLVLFESPGQRSLGVERLWIFAVLAALHGVAYMGLPRRVWSRVPPGVFAMGYGVAFALTVSMIADTKAFIYFQF